jgi:putative redox protein
VVAIEHAQTLFETAAFPKSFVTLEGADHLLTGREDAAFVASVLAAWTRRYVAPQREISPPAAPGEGVRVEESGSKLRQSIRVGKHELVADEPVAKGGHDEGPTPYELLLAGLGACTSMTLRMYADHKQWPLEHVAVRLRHSKVVAESKKGKIDRIERDLELRGDLTEEQRTRLAEIANRCPVHRTLHGEKETVTRLT